MTSDLLNAQASREDKEDLRQGKVAPKQSKTFTEIQQASCGPKTSIGRASKKHRPIHFPTQSSAWIKWKRNLETLMEKNFVTSSHPSTHVWTVNKSPRYDSLSARSINQHLPRASATSPLDSMDLTISLTMACFRLSLQGSRRNMKRSSGPLAPLTVKNHFNRSLRFLGKKMGQLTTGTTAEWTLIN